MRYTLLLALAFGLAAMRVSAQSSTEDSVKAAVNVLFTGMKNSDAAMTGGSFADSAILQTITPKGGILTEKVSAFADIVGKMTPGDADERIRFDVVRIDGPLAIVWAPYEFYYKGKYSHKGVDSFQLVRVNGVWKIQYLIDTRTK
ncbi:MAG TPA: nuclear transport factor 2 family protein [Puia sp.]|uniref:nuclear transport factor 2 family protein n=1 Tax=Puia sp. TaxID=2045100 RepID=UPI002C7B727D|nr:nuclear transport factor 2 family protein [Puia sp.]HVU96461.1 nuclear transport factor 2 family protein [Puia sp.]